MTQKVTLSRYDVSDAKLKQLTPDQRAMYGVLSLVYSEVEAFRKVLALGSQKPTGTDELDQAEISQRTVFFRLISMKLVEAFDTMMFKGKYNVTYDAGLIAFKADHVVPLYKALRKMEGFEEAIRQRKKIGFHFDLDHFREMSEASHLRGGHTAFVNGDISFGAFPYGELLVAAAYGSGGGGFDYSKAIQKIERQTKFIQEQISAFNTVFQAFFDTFVKPISTSSDERLAVPRSLVARRNVDPFPLFVLESKSK